MAATMLWALAVAYSARPPAGLRTSLHAARCAPPLCAETPEMHASPLSRTSALRGTSAGIRSSTHTYAFEFPAAEVPAPRPAAPPPPPSTSSLRARTPLPRRRTPVPVANTKFTVELQQELQQQQQQHEQQHEQQLLHKQQPQQQSGSPQHATKAQATAHASGARPRGRPKGSGRGRGRGGSGRGSGRKGTGKAGGERSKAANAVSDFVRTIEPKRLLQHAEEIQLARAIQRLKTLEEVYISLGRSEQQTAVEAIVAEGGEARDEWAAAANVTVAQLRTELREGKLARETIVERNVGLVGSLVQQLKRSSGRRYLLITCEMSLCSIDCTTPASRRVESSTTRSITEPFPSELSVVSSELGRDLTCSMTWRTRSGESFRPSEAASSAETSSSVTSPFPRPCAMD